MRPTRLSVIALLSLGLVAPALLAQSTEPRIPPLASSEAPINLLKVMANHPQLMEAWGPFGCHILNSSLPPKDREFLILRTAYLRGAEYEWGHHSRAAKALGVTDEELRLITGGSNQVEWSSFQRALIGAAEELVRNGTMSDRTWAYLDARYDEKQMMDVIFTVGQYSMVAMAIRAMRVPMDEGLEGFPE